MHTDTEHPQPTDKKPKRAPQKDYKAAHADKPLIYLGRKQDIKDEAMDNLPEIVDDIWEILAKTNKSQTRFFLSNNKPCYLSLHHVVELQPFTPQMLKSLLQEIVYFYFCTKTEDDDGDVKTEYKTRTAPGFLLTQMLNNPLYAYPLPQLERIVTAPYFTDRFQLHQQPGYHQASKTYYHLTDSRLQDLRIPEKPSQEDITNAKRLLLQDVLVDFPFSGPAELANAISTMFEPFVRSWFDVTPFRLIESARAGTGKGLLGDVLLYPFLGAMPTRTPEPKNPDGWQKLITTLLLTIPAVIFFDNIKRPVNDGSLEGILTNQVWGDRMLGGNQHVKMLNQATWLFAGNNVQIGEEIARRTVRIRMVAQTANPHQRKAFVHNPLREWVSAHRKEIVGAILTLIQHWIAQGKPIYDNAPVLGSYEKWSSTLHGILTVNEIPGFLGNLQDMIELDKFDWDDITDLIHTLWLTYHDAQTFSTNEVFDIVQADQDLPINLGSVQNGERAQRCTLGKLLSRNRERVFLVREDVLKEDLAVTIASEVQFLIGGNTHRAKLWRLQKLAEHWTVTVTEAHQEAQIERIAIMTEHLKAPNTVTINVVKTPEHQDAQPCLTPTPPQRKKTGEMKYIHRYSPDILKTTD